jgi:hypothetical protein
MYLPVTADGGLTDRYDNYLPTEISFTPTSFAKFINHIRLKPQTEFLYDVFTKPFGGPCASSQNGSGLGQALPKPSKRRTHRREEPISNVTSSVKSHSSRFIQLWYNLPLKQITVISVPSPVVPGAHDVTVILEDRLRHKPDAVRTAVHLQVPSSRAKNHKWLESDIAVAMKDFTYDSFRDKPDYDTEEEIMRP